MGALETPSTTESRKFAPFGIVASIEVIPYRAPAIPNAPVISGPNRALVQFASSPPPPPPAGEIDTSSTFQPV